LRNAGVEIAAIPEPRPLSRESEVQSTPDSPRSWWSGWLTPLDSTQAPHADFGWPLKGRVIEAFGPGDGGERNDGINILAKRGAPIKAAADGTVTYVGDELKGYGNLVLIRHGNGYVTAYAHADSVIVERGQHVRRGEVIGFAGTSGDVDTPQLHFEIRQGTTPLNPARFLMAAR
jgi:murein DD-endopeptidase MepM/ murein hydrolase activator NlpD